MSQLDKHIENIKKSMVKVKKDMVLDLSKIDELSIRVSMTYIEQAIERGEIDEKELKGKLKGN